MTNDIFEVDKLFDDLVHELSNYTPKPDLKLITECYYFLLAAIGTKGQLSEQFAYISLLTAIDIAKLRMHPKFVASALIYYLLSSKTLSAEEIAEIDKTVSESASLILKANRPFDQFLPWNKTIYSTELKEKFHRSEQKKKQKKEAQKKKEQEDKKIRFIITESKLPEIAIINIILRMHIISRLHQLVENSDMQSIIASETLDVHATVAEILGIWTIKWKIEDAVFKMMRPQAYREIVSDLNERRIERDTTINRAIKILQDTLNSEGLPAKVTGRAKHIYGLYLKMKQANLSAKEVNDNLGLRIIIDNDIGETGCYLAFDILLRLWKPVENIYGDTYCRDWIANPKPNGYQSIHTTVYFVEEEKRRLLEVQIRTEKMDEIAEYGVASHWIYKRVGNSVNLQKHYQKYVDEISSVRRAYEDRTNKI